MKKLLLLGMGLLTAGAMNAQVIFYGMSPASIQDNYEVTYSKASSNWGSPNIADPINSIQDTLVAYESDTTGCVPATNAVDLAGHIAVLYRADCQFGTKAMNAELAGAIACVIINNVPGAPIGMDGGNDGPNVGIPVAMISDVDGAALMNEMANGPVTVFFGNKAGFFGNDLGLKISQILRPRYSSIPSAIATDGTEYQVDLAAYAYNHGYNDQINVTVTAKIEFNGNEVYNEVSNPNEINSGDSTLFTFPDFAPATWTEGYYNLTYTVSNDSADQYDYDDEYESDFVISESDLSYANIDETTMLPNTSGGLRPVDGNGDPILHYSSCIAFRDANASKIAPKAISFSASKGSDAPNESIAGEELFFHVYRWNDVFTDMNDVSNPIGSYDELMMDIYTYPDDAGGDIVTGTFDINDVVPLVDNQRYLFCVTTFNEYVFLGHDPTRDYSYNLDYYLQPLFPIEAGMGVFNPYGFGPTSVPGVTVSFINADELNLKNEKLAIKMNVYPSPASDILNVDFNQNEVNKVELINTMGQTVAVEEVANNAEKTTIDVASVENGVYIVKVYLSNNMTHTMQVVVNH